MRPLLALLILWSTFIAVPATATPGEDWRYADMVNLIESRNSAGTPFKSPEEFIAAFPEGVRNTFTFVYETGSKSQGADTLNPRAFVFNNKLIYTFNGSPSQIGNNTIEVMEFDEIRRKFEFREIAFTKQDNNPVVEYSSSTPHKCMECHGSDPRPIWAQYGNWPGFYGSNHDRIEYSEGVNYKQFLARSGDVNSRYKNLFFRKGSPVSPYNDPAISFDRKFRPNLAITKLLVNTNALRIARMIEESPLYGSLNLMFVSFLSPIFSVFIEPSLKVRVIQRLDQIIADRKIRVKPGAEIEEKLLAIVGMSVQRFSMQLGDEDYLYTDGGYNQMELVQSALVRDLIANGQDLGPITFQPRLTDYYDAFTVYKHADDLLPLVKHCTDETKRILVEKLAYQLDHMQLPPPTEPEHSFEELLRQAAEIRVNPDIPVSCVFCHTVSSDPSTGPHIAFDDEAQLARSLRKDNNRLLNKLISRSAPNAGTDSRMPPPSSPDFTALSNHQHRAFSEYLRNLVKP